MEKQNHLSHHTDMEGFNNGKREKEIRNSVRKKRAETPELSPFFFLSKPQGREREIGRDDINGGRENVKPLCLFSLFHCAAWSGAMLKGFSLFSFYFIYLFFSLNYFSSFKKKIYLIETNQPSAVIIYAPFSATYKSMGVAIYIF